MCPILYRRMRSQIFKYKDEALEYKISLLRGGVHYLAEVEREALVEIAFQMKLQAYRADDLIVKQLDKIDSLRLVFDGELHCLVLSSEACYVLERLPTGASYGLYSVLRYADRGFGHSRLKIVTSKYSWIARIPISLLLSVRQMYRSMNKQMNKA